MNAPVLHRRLDGLAAKLQPVGINSYVTWLAGPAHQHLQRRALQRFKSNEPGGGMWPELTEATANWRRFYGYGPYRPINRRTGKLRALMTQGAPTIGSDALGTYLVYPGRGADRPDMKIRLEQAQGLLVDANGRRSTQRAVIVLEADDLAALTLSFAKWLSTGLGMGRR